MSAERLERALAGLGLSGEVEVRGALAIFRAEGRANLEDARLREAAVAAAAEHGYTHLALELVEDPDDGAPLRRY